MPPSSDETVKDLIAAQVRGKSFADAGAACVIGDVALPAAMIAGARLTTVIDDLPLDALRWSEFETEMRRAHAAGFSRIWADLSTRPQLAASDVVYTRNAPLRVRAPQHWLEGLRAITGETAIIDLATPGPADGLEMPADGALSLTSLSGVQEIMAAAFLEAHAPGQWCFAPAHEATPGAAFPPAWFWLFSEQAAAKLIREAGFSITRTIALDEGARHVFVCAPQAVPVDPADERANDRAMRAAHAGASLDLAKWREGIAYEANFWREIVRTGGLSWPQEFQARISPDQPLDPVMDDLIARSGKTYASILDAGAGPFTSLGSRSAHALLELHACDALAPVYDHILAVWKLTPPVRTSFAPVEALDIFTAGRIFDYTHVCNALDHSFNPFLGILQLLASTALDGALLLRHHENEALRANYSDFHQFNFEVKEDQFFIWNRTLRINAGEWLQGLATIETLPPQMGADVLIRPLPATRSLRFDQAKSRALWVEVRGLVEDALKSFDAGSPDQQNNQAAS